MAVIGIDLGTTNSLAAYWKDGTVQLIPTGAGECLLPSVVSYVAEKDALAVGALAKQRQRLHESETAASFKRFMGTEKHFYIGNKTYTAYELSALVLEKLKQEAEWFLGEEIEEAIVTVPAYFNDRQRSDTKKAAKLAGLNVKRLINEPSAAALAYRMQTDKEDLSLLVFDFGGGTLDLSLVECFDDVVEIIGIAGDNFLGGDDIDRSIAQWFCAQTGIHMQELDGGQRQLLLEYCERAKRELNENEQVTIAVLEHQVCLTRAQLYEICLPLFARIKTLFLRVLKDCGYHIAALDDVVLVGGSSQLVVLHQFLTELLGKAPVLLGDTDKVVAMGAGVYAGIRERKADIKDMVLTDVCPFTLGLGSVHNAADAREHMDPIIERNCTLPARREKTYYSVGDYQRIMDLTVYQGEEYDADENVKIGTFFIKLPPRPAGMAWVRVCFMYDLNGILQVEAENEEGLREKLLIAGQELSEAEIEQSMMRIRQLSFAEEYQVQIQTQRELLHHFYKQSIGAARTNLAVLIGWYERELGCGKRYRQKQAVDRMEQMLRQMRVQELVLNEYLLRGEGMPVDLADKSETAFEED